MKNVDKEFSRLVLGTAQLGMPYGIANRTGKPDYKKAYDIVHAAWEGGVRCFDTAQAYGDSERVLGRALSSLRKPLQEPLIVTKLDPMLDITNPKATDKAIQGSLRRLKVERLYALMFHFEELPPSLALNNGLKDLLSGYRRDGLIGHIGISVYTPKSALQALQCDLIDLVQVPTNVLDRRFLNAGVFDLAMEMGKEIFIRSVFLQGLLLMDSDRLPASMDFAAPVVRSFTNVSESAGVPRIVLAFGYVRLRFPRTRVIFGAETVDQVENNLKNWCRDIPDGLLSKIDENLSNTDEQIVDPRQWPH
ncbi:MAG: aldo/keto reductase [Deltaproteobacteria bacterium]|nr:aldo/keto reductase [Deltaproteobacteria bacterium]